MILARRMRRRPEPQLGKVRALLIAPLDTASVRWPSVCVCVPFIHKLDG